ncbi:hypothetical protein A2U01_0089151, partial [Trifolium medium]|nr:hypothetical protein [Trifolium medium]
MSPATAVLLVTTSVMLFQ